MALIRSKRGLLALAAARMQRWAILPVGVMNAVTNTGSLYYTANVNETTEKGPCVAMTPYGVIGLERVNGVPV